MASRRDLIVTAIVSLLNQTITIGGGYNNGLAVEAGGGGAQKPGAVENPLAALPVVIVSAPEEDKDEDSSRHTYIRNRLRIELECVPDQDGVTPVEDQIDDLVEDIERVLLAQAFLEQPPLGVAGVEEIRIHGHTKLPVDSENLDGALMVLTVLYRHDEDDPRTYGVAM